MRTFFHLAVVALALLLFGCATTDSVMAFKQRKIEPTLTRKSFERIEPNIKNLQSGQPMESTGLTWSVYEISSGNRLVGLVAYSDGWIGCLSGNIDGAFTKFGEPVALENGLLYGQHIYGYIVKPSLFVPRYALQTVATVIDNKEFRALLNSRTKGIGSTFKGGGSKEEFYFKDLKVFQVKELYKSEEDFSGIQMGKAASLSEAALLFSKQKYERSADKIRTLTPGSDLFSVIKSLNGLYVAHYGGSSYTLFMDGFLKYKGEYFVSKTTSHGIYYVWPFGYVENGKEVPKTALIFKNGVLQSVVPYSSKQEISEQLE